MAATLKDIAKATGLSVPSVCLILNGQGHKFRDESRRAVMEASRQLRYRPDMMMRRMGRASARRDAIGFLAPMDPPESLVEHSWQEYMSGVNAHLLKHDQLLVMAGLNGAPWTGQGANGSTNSNGSSGSNGSNGQNGHENRPPRLLSERFVDGLIIVETGLPRELQQLVSHYEIMTVWLNSEKTLPVDCAYPDEEHAGKIATEQLISAGHRSVAFVESIGPSALTGLVRRHGIELRQLGYRRAMLAAGLEPVTHTIDEHPASLGEFVRTLAASRSAGGRPITGLVTSSLVMAVRILEEIAGTALSCPKDVSIISAGDVPIVRAVWPNVVRVRCDRHTIGGWAAEMILEKVNQNGAEQPSRIYRGSIVGGATCGPANH